MKVDTELERQRLQGAFEALGSAIWLCAGCGFSADAWPIVEMQEDSTCLLVVLFLGPGSLRG
jgi:hypothetical protein